MSGRKKNYKPFGSEGTGTRQDCSRKALLDHLNQETEVLLLRQWLLPKIRQPVSLLRVCISRPRFGPWCG
jgi:hypothetical protein